MNKFEVKNKAGDEDGEWEFPSFGPPILKVRKKTSHHNYYSIHFDEYIKEPSYYREVIETITEANEGDVIELIINSPGGHLDSAGAIIGAIENSEADIIATIVGQCHSAASLIALSCPGIRVGRFANMMVHQASFGAGGPSSSVYSMVDFNKKYLTRVIEEAYKDFLSEEEIQQVLGGREIWMNSEEIGERLKVLFELKSEEVQSQVDALQAEVDRMKEAEGIVVETPQPAKKVPRKRASKAKQ